MDNPEERLMSCALDQFIFNVEKLKRDFEEDMLSNHKLFLNDGIKDRDDFEAFAKLFVRSRELDALRTQISLQVLKQGLVDNLWYNAENNELDTERLCRDLGQEIDNVWKRFELYKKGYFSEVKMDITDTQPWRALKKLQEKLYILFGNVEVDTSLGVFSSDSNSNTERSRGEDAAAAITTTSEPQPGTHGTQLSETARRAECLDPASPTPPSAVPSHKTPVARPRNEPQTQRPPPSAPSEMPGLDRDSHKNIVDMLLFRAPRTTERDQQKPGIPDLNTFRTKVEQLKKFFEAYMFRFFQDMFLHDHQYRLNKKDKVRYGIINRDDIEAFVTLFVTSCELDALRTQISLQVLKQGLVDNLRYHADANHPDTKRLCTELGQKIDKEWEDFELNKQNYVRDKLRMSGKNTEQFIWKALNMLQEKLYKLFSRVEVHTSLGVSSSDSNSNTDDERSRGVDRGEDAAAAVKTTSEAQPGTHALKGTDLPKPRSGTRLSETVRGAECLDPASPTPPSAVPSHKTPVARPRNEPKTQRPPLSAPSEMPVLDQDSRKNIVDMLLSFAPRTPENGQRKRSGAQDTDSFISPPKNPK